MTRSDAVKLCGARTRTGGTCKREAGWGTAHLGAGSCKLHSGSTPNGVKAAAKAEAVSFAVGRLGASVEIDPLDAQVLAVWLSNGVVEYWRAKLASEADAPATATIDGYARALVDFSRFSKAAVESGVAERLVNVAERAADQIVQVCEDGLAALMAAGVALTVAQRTVYAKAVEKALVRLEADRQVGVPALEAGSGADDA